MALLLFKRRLRWTQPHTAFLIFVCSFGVLWSAIAWCLAISANSKPISGLRNYAYQIVEGQVTDFKPMPYEGHTEECFSVQQQRFCYSDYEISPGFHQSASHGGPIHEGLPVRIAYSGGVILRLQVPADQAVTPTQAAAVEKASEQDWQHRTEADPFLQKVNTAFYATMLGWTLWWNLSWRRVMRFWVRPPYRRLTEIGFRIFFAANLIGAATVLFGQLRHHPLNASNAAQTLKITVIMSCIVAGMSFFALKTADRRDRALPKA